MPRLQRVVHVTGRHNCTKALTAILSAEVPQAARTGAVLVHVCSAADSTTGTSGARSLGRRDLALQGKGPATRGMASPLRTCEGSALASLGGWIDVHGCTELADLLVRPVQGRWYLDVEHVALASVKNSCAALGSKCETMPVVDPTATRLPVVGMDPPFDMSIATSLPAKLSTCLSGLPAAAMVSTKWLTPWISQPAGTKSTVYRSGWLPV
jgi:hypothetical protein